MFLFLRVGSSGDKGFRLSDDFNRFCSLFQILSPVTVWAPSVQLLAHIATVFINPWFNCVLGGDDLRGVLGAPVEELAGTTLTNGLHVKVLLALVEVLGRIQLNKNFAALTPHLQVVVFAVL